MRGRHSSTLGIAALSVIVFLGISVAASAQIAMAPSASVPGAPMGSVIGLVRLGPLSWTNPTMPFESLQAGYPSVLWDGGVYKMWYFGCPPSYDCMIGYATSADGRNWTGHGPVLSPSFPEDSLITAYPEVVKVGATYRMWYGGFNGSNYRILAATSADGTNWTKLGVAIDLGPAGSQDGDYTLFPRVVFANGQYMMWYTGRSTPQPPNSAIMLATSTDGLSWTKHGIVLDRGGPGALDAYGAFGGDVIYDGSMYRMLYDGQANASSSLFLYATSVDGYAWQKRGIAMEPQPPYEREIWFPSIVPIGDRWYVFYSARANYSDLSFYEAVGPSPTPSSGPGPSQSVAGIPTFVLILVVAVVAAAVVVFGLAWYLSLPRRPPRA